MICIEVMGTVSLRVACHISQFMSQIELNVLKL